MTLRALTDGRQAEVDFLILNADQLARVDALIAQSADEPDASMRHLCRAKIYADAFMLRETLMELTEAARVAEAPPGMMDLVNTFAQKHAMSSLRILDPIP